MDKLIDVFKGFMYQKKETPKTHDDTYIPNTVIIDEFFLPMETHDFESLKYASSIQSDDSLLMETKIDLEKPESYRNLIIKTIKEEDSFCNEGRPWRFINNHFMNDLAFRLSRGHKLKYMESVEKVINIFYENYFKDCNEVKLNDVNVILFVDIDNWARLFKLPALLPKKTFVYCFRGGKNNWKPPEE